MTRRTLPNSLALTVALAWPGLSGASEYKVLKGAQVSPKARARAVDVDLRDLPIAPEWQPGDPIKEIPRRHYPRPKPPRQVSPPLLPEPAEDPLLELQAAAPIASEMAFTTPILNFAGQGFSGVNPPDTVGDVGPSHYIQMINHSSGATFAVYNKSTGGLISGPTVLDSLGTGNCASGLGDPVVLYDSQADRWFLSEFSSSGNKLCVYVSKTADPVSGGYWAYEFTAPGFPDYPKYAVWPDAYYVSTNESSPAAYALDRTRMLQGQAATFQRFTAPDLAGFSFQALAPADLDGATAPPAGAPAIFMRHRDDEAHNAGANDPTQDFVEIWQFHVDWTTPATSTFSGPTAIGMAEFDSSLCGLTSFSCIPQPSGTNALDPLREVIMFRLQYRNFGTYQSLAGNFVTDVNGADRAGIRWFELRKTGAGAWTLQQQGTYSPDAVNRWMGGSAMDKQGNFAVGYSVSNSSTFPGIRYAGRLTTDPAGTLPQGETTIVSGSASNASNRWGDYAAMSVDPGDDCTFWFTTEYSPSSSWGTRIASFKFDSCAGGPPTPDFSVSASPSSLSINAGSSGTSTITVASINGFSSGVTLSASGLPSGVTASFSPNPITPPANGSATSTLTLTVAASAPSSTSTVTITGTSGATTRTTSLGLTVNGAGGASYDATLKAPKCATVSSACDSGASLLLGRDGKGPEPNQPNTINNSCADGTSGTFHSDESNDRLKVSTTDGSNFAPGKTVRIEATVWAWTTPSSDHLDLYYAANATSPTWTFITTLTPTAAGAQTLSATYTLPAGSLQAVRARFRYNGSASACTAGSYDDHDDLIFAVNGGGGDTTPPTTSITSPANGSTVSGVTTISASASDNVGVTQVEFHVDGALKSTDTTSPYSYAWDTTIYANGSTHTLVSKAYDAAGNVGTSATVTVTVNNGAVDLTAAYDSVLRAPKCATVGKSCNSATLVNGRDGKGPEPNQPNTINGSCADGTSGTYHVDESNDTIKVLTTDGTAFAAGKTVRIEATVWAWTSGPSSDKLDLYYAANANSPTWTFLTTLTPAAGGAQTLSATYTLPAGSLQAVRAQFRYLGSASSCTTGGYNDRDDLIFAVQ